jgi:5-methylcytosine-specific restriction endonuclease McrA
MWWVKRKKIETNPFSLRDKHQRYYQTSTHQRWRLAILNRDPLCVKCLENNVLEPSIVADHKDSLTTRWDLRSSIENGQGLCARCHNIKSAVERGDYIKHEQLREIDKNMSNLNSF